MKPEDFRANLEERHRNGNLIVELPLMKSALSGLRKQNEKKTTAKKIYEMALDIVGVKDEDIHLEETIPLKQAMIYAMLNGGFLATAAIRNPKGFYLDDRANIAEFNGKKADIYREVIALEKMAVENNLNPADLPNLPIFHNMGAF